MNAPEASGGPPEDHGLLPDDLHRLPPDRFREHVHSFEYWLETVNGYLDGRSFGRRPEIEEEALEPDARDRLVRVLCSYCVGETIALDGAGELIRRAPSRAVKVFLATQVADEGRHLEVLVHRMSELGVEDPEAEVERSAHPALLRFKKKLLELIESGDWFAAVFAQNVILEAMEFTAFHRHARGADPVTRDLLLGIIKDERRHIGFGENELGRRLRGQPGLRARLGQVRSQLDPLVLECFGETLDLLGSPRSEREELGRDYLSAVRRLGIQ